MYNVLKVITLVIYIVIYYHYNILLGVQQSIQLPISTAVTTNTQSLLSSDQQHYSVSPSKPNIVSIGVIYNNLALHTYMYHTKQLKSHQPGACLLQPAVC